MTSKEHKKHTKLTRPLAGNFGRNEWALEGAPCSDIKLLADNIIAALSPKYKCAYADATHDDELSQPAGRLASGAVLEHIEHVDFDQFNVRKKQNRVALLQQFAAADLILVNGNHHTAKAQVVIIHSRKKASLQKRLSQLTNVELFLLADTDDIFDFIKDAIPNWRQIPIYRVKEIDKIINFFHSKVQQAKPVLNGLVLAGGKSVRMGQDKGAIKWFNKEQRYHIADILMQQCDDVFISCRTDQQLQLAEAYKALPDTFVNLGPYGAILSAFREQPDSAWLVVACDMPLLDSATLTHLIENRDPSSIATTYKSDFEGLPEPLITIWEPKSYPVLLAYLAQGYSCPRKVLINSDVLVLSPLNSAALTNVNTPQDFEIIKQKINSNTVLLTDG